MFRLKDKYNKGILDLQSESDSSSDEEISPRKLQKDIVEFMKVISAIRSKDPDIYKNDGKKFFQEKSDSESSDSENENEKDKLTLKKYNLKFVEQGGKFDEDDDDV